MNISCIFSHDDEGRAQVVAEFLESRGIPALVKNQYLQNLFGGLKIFTGFDPVVGTAKVFVREDQADEALALLSAEPLAALDEDEEGLAPAEELSDSDKDLASDPS